MYTYVYQAALYCEECGEAIRERLAKEGTAPADPDDETSFDSSDYPKGPFADGGGEADCPQHCDACGEFLENPLTEEGSRYVRENLTEAVLDGRQPDQTNSARESVTEDWADYYDIDPDLPAEFVNPGDRSWTKGRYILCFGAYGDTLLMAWANNLDDALDECIDWIADNAPGLLADEQVAEEYKLAIAEGLSEEDAQERATVDITCGGNCGNYLNSWEWGISAENPNGETVRELMKRALEAHVNKRAA